MQTDYTYPSVYLAYLMFFLLAALAVYFFARTWRDGYWGKDGEDVKFTVFEQGENDHHGVR
jgi:hypothetical protein